MKTKQLTILLLLLANFLYAQDTDNDSRSGNYIFTKAFVTKLLVNFQGDSINTEIIVHKPGRKFSIVNSTKEYYIIQYWKWNEKIEKEKKVDSFGNKVDTLTIKDQTAFNLNKRYFQQINEITETPIIYNANDYPLKYFKIKKEDFDKVCTKYYNKWLPVTAGIYSVPFKIRLRNFEFEQDLNLGVSLGFPFRIFKTSEKKWIVEPNLGIGITKINLNEKNTNSTVTEERTANALTFSGGMLFRFSEKINLGLFGGWDFLSNSDRDTNWIYDRQFWLGVGINISFNSSGEKREERGANKTIKDGE